MIEVSFDGINFCKKYQVVLEQFDIGMPEPKIVRVSIPGRDGDLDMSEALTGYLNYGDREITVQIGITGDEKTCEKKKSNVLSFVAGKEGKLTFSHLEGYFLGRCTVKSITREIAHYTLLLSFSCRPYRYAENLVVKSETLGDKAISIDCENTMMPTSPTIEVSENATVSFNGKTYTYTKGEHRPSFIFMNGDNKLSVKGKGVIKIIYRKGVI